MPGTSQLFLACPQGLSVANCQRDVETVGSPLCITLYHCELELPLRLLSVWTRHAFALISKNGAPPLGRQAGQAGLVRSAFQTHAKALRSRALTGPKKLGQRHGGALVKSADLVRCHKACEMRALHEKAKPLRLKGLGQENSPCNAVMHIAAKRLDV